MTKRTARQATEEPAAAAAHALEARRVVAVAGGFLFVSLALSAIGEHTPGAWLDAVTLGAAAYAAAWLTGAAPTKRLVAALVAFGVWAWLGRAESLTLAPWLTVASLALGIYGAHRLGRSGVDRGRLRSSE